MYRQRHNLAIILNAVALLLLPSIAFASTNTNSGQFVSASSQYAAITTSNLGITGGAITMEAWVYFTSAPATNHECIIAEQESGSSSFVANILWYQNNSGTFSVVATRGKSFVANNSATWTTTLSLNTWYHLVYDYDGSTVTLYEAIQNGTHSSEATVASSGNGSTSGNNNFSFGAGDSTAQGASFSASAFCDALIDDVRVWNTNRTTTQLDANFQQELVGNETNLVAYYNLDNNWNDLTSNAFNLTTHGSPTFSTTVPFTGSTPPASPSGATLWSFFGF
jgi:hypothetical protein